MRNGVTNGVDRLAFEGKYSENALVDATQRFVSHKTLQSFGGDVAGDDWDDFGLAALGLHMRNGSGSPLSSGIVNKVVRSKLAK
jgi:hypothetical protein